MQSDSLIFKATKLLIPNRALQANSKQNQALGHFRGTKVSQSLVSCTRLRVQGRMTTLIRKRTNGLSFPAKPSSGTLSWHESGFGLVSEACYRV